MPLEIRELLIRVSIRDRNIQDSLNDDLKEKLQEIKTKMVKECTDKVLEKIEQNMER